MATTAGEALEDIFPGDSKQSARMRAHDWSATALGDPFTWPAGLTVPLGMLLTSRFEMWLGWGPDLLFFYNDAYIPTLGAKHPEMLGKPFREVWSEVYDQVADQVASVRAGNSTWNDALLLLLERHGFPEESYHSFSYSPLRGPSGAVDGMLCVVSEETERVIGQRRMQMLGTLGQSLTGTVARVDVETGAMSVLAANSQDFPFSLLLERDHDGSWHGKAASPGADHLLRHEWAVDPSGMTVQVPIDASLDPPSGAWDRPPAHALLVPIRQNAQEAPYGALVLAVNPCRPDDPDLANLGQLLAGQIAGALGNVAMLESERRRADRVWTNSRDLIVTVDAGGILRSVSPSWTRILGHEADEVVGRHFAEFLDPEDASTTSSALERASSEQDLTGFENRYLTRAGEPRWISWHTSVEDDLVFAYGRDITTDKANAAALAAAEDTLRQAMKMEAVGQLTGGIAHDFNNLLTGIIGSLEMMQRKAEQGRTADVERYATAATSSANRAAALTQRLLAFARRQSLDPKLVDANFLVRGTEDLLRRSIGEGVALEVVAAGGLWNTRCDPNQLENAILNLAINARDAMPDGGRLTIETGNASIDASYAASNAFATPGQYVTISVSDTGHGMSKDIVAKAFDPFFTTKPIGQGTGLGLSMIYGFARQSGGFVNIYSEVGQGTTIRVYLPRFYGASETVDAPAEVPDVPRSDEGEIVLVVEDESAVRSLIVDVLGELGYRTLQAIDGPSGLEILNSVPRVDLLVTDVGLPGLNGRQLADAARERRPDLKVLFVTGYAHNAAVGSGLLGPGMEIITKPFAIDKLASRVKSIIEATP